MRPFSTPLPAVAQGSAATKPTDGSTDGIPLAGPHSGGVWFARVRLSADNGKTLDGTGNMRCFVQAMDGRWGSVPELDFAITPAGGSWTAQRDRISPQFDVGVQAGRITWVPDLCGSNGTNVTPAIEAMEGNPYVFG